MATTVTIPTQRFGPGQAINIQPLQFTTSRKVSDLKAVIRSHTGIHPSNQLIVEKATMKRLDENEFLSRYTQGGTFEVYVLDSTAFQVYYAFNAGENVNPVWVFPTEQVGDVVTRIIDAGRADKNYQWTANRRGTSLANTSTVSNSLAAGDKVLMVRGAYGG